MHNPGIGFQLSLSLQPSNMQRDHMWKGGVLISHDNSFKCMQRGLQKPPRNCSTDLARESPHATMPSLGFA